MSGGPFVPLALGDRTPRSGEGSHGEFFVNRRVGDRRVVFVLLTRPEKARAGERSLPLQVGYTLHRVGTRSGVTARAEQTTHREGVGAL